MAANDADCVLHRLAAALPAGAVPCRARTAGVRRATDPHRKIGLHGLGRNRSALQAIVPAREVDAVFTPQAGDESQGSRRCVCRASWCRCRAWSIRSQRAADAEGGQQPALGQDVDGRALLGQQDRIAQRQRHDIHTEAQAAGAAGKSGHGRHALQMGVRLTSRSVCQIESTPPCSQRSTQRQ